MLIASPLGPAYNEQKCKENCLLYESALCIPRVDTPRADTPNLGRHPPPGQTPPGQIAVKDFGAK